MHCSTPVATRTRSKRRKNDPSEVVVGVSSDDEDVVVVWDEVPAKFQQRSYGTERFASAAMQSHGVAVSEEEEEEDGDGDEMEAGQSNGENRVETELGMKRKRKFGLDILVDHNAPKDEFKSVAQRVRSRFRNKNKKKQKLGTFSQPICLYDDDDDEEEEEEEKAQEEEQEKAREEKEEQEQEKAQEEQEKAQKEKEEEERAEQEVNVEEEKDEEESDSLSDFDDDDDDDDDDSEEGSDSDSDDEDYRVSGYYQKKEGYACAEKLPKKSGKIYKKKSGVDVVKILKDSMLGKCEVPLEDIEEIVEDGDYDGDGEKSKIPFSEEKSAPPKKSGEGEEDDDDLDEIWEEMKHGLEAKSQRSTGSDSLHSSLEDGRVYNEVKSRGSYKKKGSAFTRKKLDGVHDQVGFGEFSDILLQDSIHDDKAERSPDAAVKGRNSCGDMPLKFNFRPEEPPPAEKSESEKEMDALFEEMELSLYIIQQEKAALEAQAAKNKECDDKYPIDDPKTPALYRCRGGVHELIRNWEIGDYCRYCGYVAMDIRSWTPPFLENPFGKYDRRDYYAEDDVDQNVFDELRDRNAGYDDYNHCNHKGTVWDIIPGVRETMYPHQREAFEFLWKNLAGGTVLDKFKGESGFPDGSGCIISHAPGTGKTRLTIVFLQTYMELNPTCTPMIIAPKGMLLTWEEEFKTWKVDIPFHNLNNFEYSGNEDEATMNLIRKYGHNASTQAAKQYCRIAKLYSWKLGKSILGVSYKLFEQLTRKGSPDKDLRKFLLERPGLVVLDEGHTPRNSKSWLWKSVTEIQTERRIILSGTPFQNNFDELYNTLCLARPEFAKRNPRKENRGRWGYLTNSFGKVTDDSRRFEILKKIRNMIQPFVHVHKGTILQDSLPGLRQAIVILKPTQLQKQLLDDIQREREKLEKGKKTCKNILKIEYKESVTAVHPSLFQLSEEGKNKFQRLRLNPEESAKTKFLMELIRISEIFNEKVLVFSQFIEPLKLLTSQLKHIFDWSEGREVLQMHGKLEAKLRQASIKAFNDPKSKVRVMLASTKACYEGISLVGASRVVLLDVVWNPSVERQAISRAYRLGQEKFVHTYHLITVGTRDEEKCSRQAEKDELSELVFFNSDAAQHREVHSSSELEDRVLEHMVQQQNLRHMLEKVAIKKQNLL